MNEVDKIISEYSTSFFSTGNYPVDEHRKLPLDMQKDVIEALKGSDLLKSMREPLALITTLTQIWASGQWDIIDREKRRLKNLHGC